MNKGIEILEMGYSINIKNDFKNNQKIGSYIPTEKSSKLLEKLLLGMSKGSSNSYLLSGAYGSGKSFFISVLLNLLTSESVDEKTKLIDRINDKHSLKETYSKLKDNRYLTIFIDEKFKSFKKGLLVGILEGIKKNRLEFTLKNDFNVIINKIESWQENQRDIITKIEIELKKDDILLEDYIKNLKEYNEKALKRFMKIYEGVFYGEKFVNLESKNGIQELLKDFEDQVIKSGKYDGVIYVFDEFGRYLESNINSIDVKEIQDMAEYCNDDTKSSLFMITHKDIFQYTNKLNRDDNILEWEKVSGRFQKEYLTYEKLTSLDIIAESMIKKDIYNNYKIENKDKFQEYYKLLKNSKITSEVSEVVGEKFFPLNYLSAQLLPDLSQKIAQNERTMFAFISSTEGKSLRNIIGEDFVIGLDRLYDYFEENFKFLKAESVEYKSYVNGKNIISKLSNETEIKIIKSLSLLYIYNKFSDIEPTKEILELAVGTNNNEFENSLNLLQEKNYITYKRNFNHFKIVEDSDINIEKDIKKYIEDKLKIGSYTELLNKHLPLDIYYPLMYNTKNDITRYFNCYYLDTSNIGDIDNIIKKSQSDGTIIYLTNIQKENSNLRLIEDFLVNKDILVVKNRKTKKLNIGYYLKELEAIECLLLSNEKYGEGIVKSEITLYKEEIKELLIKELGRYFAKDERSIYLKEEKYKSSDLLKVTDNYLERKYNKFIPFNYELINKQVLSAPMKKVRLTLFNLLLENNKQLGEDEFYEGTGAINSVARKLFVENKFFNNGEIRFLDGYENIYLEICKEIETQEICIEDIYEKYCGKNSEYGLRKGLFTFILGFIIIKNKDIFSINSIENKSREILSGELLEKIEKTPKAYGISFVKVSKEQKIYVENLKAILKDFIQEDINEEEAILEGFKNYFYSLPRIGTNLFIKEAKILSKIMLSIFKDKNAYDFIYKEIPLRCKTENLTTVINILEIEIEEIKEKLENYSIEIEKKIILSLGGDGFSPLKDVVINWQEKTTVIENSFENWLKKYKYISKSKFLIDLTEKVKGFNYENWISKNDLDDFNEKLKKSLEKKDRSKEELDIVNINFGKESLNIEIKKEKSQMAKVLKQKLESSIKSMAKAISEDEKRSILVEILKEL